MILESDRTHNLQKFSRLYLHGEFHYDYKKLFNYGVKIMVYIFFNDEIKYYFIVLMKFAKQVRPTELLYLMR